MTVKLSQGAQDGNILQSTLPHPKSEKSLGHNTLMSAKLATVPMTTNIQKLTLKKNYWLTT